MQIDPQIKIAKSFNDICHSHNSKIMCHIDKLESERPFNFEHFDTSFDQNDKKN